MPSSFKRIRIQSVPAFVAIFGIMLLLLGCDQTEKRFARALETAKSAYESGSYPVVISSLDPYLTIFPENLEIKTLVGLSHVRSGNPFEGAVLLQQAYRADPDLLHFAKEAGQAFKEVGDNESAIEAFRSYLDVFNDDAQSKLSLAQLILEKGRQSEALGLMLEAEKQAPQAIRPIDSLTLGELFMNQGNSVQARRYFSRIESSDDFSVSLPAQLKLIRIAAQDNNWPEVETRIGSMDQQLPGAFDSSDLAPLRQQLADWNAAKLAMEEERRRQEEAAAQAQAELLAAQAEQEATEATEEIEVTPPDDAEPADEPAETPEATTEDSAEALAQTEPAETSAEDTAPPADASSDTQPLSDAELLATDFSPADTSAPPAETEEPTESAPAGTLTPFEEAILRGDAALASQDPETAIDAYYDAQSYDPENSLVWEKLADAYQMQNEGRKAEIALLEAMRHAPEYADLRIRYLRFVQTLGDPAKLMRSIQDAKERFPDNATITLLLARAYERIEQNDRIARFYYNQFIQLAPNDPQVPAVRQRLLGR